MRIQYELKLDDMVEAGRHITPKRDFAKFLVYQGIAAFAVGFLMLVARPDGGGWVAPTALLVFGSVLMTSVISERVRSSSEHWTNSQRIVHPTTLDLRDEGVEVACLHWKSEYRWSTFSHWKESKNLFMLFVTAENMIYIPKRAFASNCEIETFRAAIDSGISGTSHGFPIQIRQPAGQ